MSRQTDGGRPPGPVTPIRVLAAIDWLEVGGAQQHLLTLARGLSGGGFHVVVATSADEPLAAAFRDAGIEVRSLARRSITHRLSPLFTVRLARLAQRGGFDLIHGHLHSASLAAAVAAGLSGLPLVVTHHSMNTWRPVWHRALGRWADRRAQAVIAVATNIAGAVERGGVRPWLIPNGVPVPAKLWSPAEVAAARAQLGVPPDAYVIGYVGRLVPDKNPLLFVEAAALVAARCPRAHFLLVGDGPLRPAVAARGRALGLGGRLTFTGLRPNTADLLPLADVLALSSQSEGAPLVVLEAMAAARPVVATAVGDVARQIVDGQTGFVVMSEDAPGLAARLLELADPALRSRFGQAARERVIAHFSLDRCLAQTAAVYREVLASASRKASASAGSPGRRHRGAVTVERRSKPSTDDQDRPG